MWAHLMKYSRATRLSSWPSSFLPLTFGTTLNVRFGLKKLTCKPGTRLVSEMVERGEGLCDASSEQLGWSTGRIQPRMTSEHAAVRWHSGYPPHLGGEPLQPNHIVTSSCLLCHMQCTGESLCGFVPQLMAAKFCNGTTDRGFQILCTGLQRARNLKKEGGRNGAGLELLTCA